jgi:hypothetical protein
MRFQELTVAVGEWSKRNFGDKQNPYLGLIEELGELSHCLLKRQQGIRGYESPSFFQGEYMDALGDICIYAANYAYNEGIAAQWPNRILAEETANRYIARACYYLFRLSMSPEVPSDLEVSLNGLLSSIAHLAALEQLDLAEIAEKTWEVVSVRDWIVNAQDGKVAEV